MGTSYNCEKWCSATTNQIVNSSIISKGAMNSFNEKFLLARMFPLAVMQSGDLNKVKWGVPRMHKEHIRQKKYWCDFEQKG